MKALLPGSTLGVMGGGQLARMFVHAAQRMGYFTAVLDPDAGSPAGRVSHHHVQADYVDELGLAELSGHSAAITTEFENVPAQSLARLAGHRLVAPGADAVAIAQDRGLEKAHFIRCGVACAPHALIVSPADIDAVADDLLPGILKTAQLGYDGKGQVRVRSRDELRAGWDTLQRAPCVLEKMLPLAFECSVVVARGRDGAMVHLPVQHNLHREGILAVTQVFDGCVPAAQAARAIEATHAIAAGLDYVGVLCVEFFGLADGSMVVNEMAPRPHNSGHWSLDAADVSQFELQVRTLAGLPLAQPRQHSPA
ncbi:MAG: 5-(carboxyamino)imidazole ribonucleotide synthase, partial [Comamonadaceae bacterium]